MAYDWDTIRRDYVQGYTENKQLILPTLEQLCDKHGCSLSTAKKRSAKENWQQERNLFGTKKEQIIEEKKLSIMAGESANFDNMALDVAKKGLKIVKTRLDDKELSNHDAQKLSNTASTFHKMGKLALGEPTDHIKETNNTDVNLHDKVREREEYYKSLNTTSKSPD